MPHTRREGIRRSLIRGSRASGEFGVLALLTTETPSRPDVDAQESLPAALILAHELRRDVLE